MDRFNTAAGRLIMSTVVLVTLALVSCHKTAQTPAGSAVPEGPVPDWNHPLVGAVSVGTPADVSTLVPFPVKTPPSLGTPSAVWVTDPASSSPTERSVALVYTSSPDGIVNIIEQTSQTTEADLEGLVAHNGDAGGTATFSTTSLSGNRVGVLEAGPVSNSIMWLEGPVLFTVVGPTASFTTDAAVSVANEL